MAGHAAARGQDAGGGMHAVDVLGAGLDAHQDDLAPVRLQRLGLVGVEHDLAGRGARARPAGRVPCTSRSALGIDRRVQQLIERGGIDAGDRLRLVDQAFRDHVDGDLERRLGGALAGARLQHPELAALDGELDVLHVAVVRSQRRDVTSSAKRPASRLQRRQLCASLVARRLGDRLRRADAGDHVLALRVDQVLAVELASRRSTGCG